MDPASAVSRPSDVLKAEHQVILRVLRVLEWLVEQSESNDRLDRDAAAKCVQFFQGYADACHHCKEEDLLFPLMESRGVEREDGPIGAMIYDHAAARELVGEMDAAVAAAGRGDARAIERFGLAARAYAELLRKHIDDEDNTYFPLGDAVLTEADQQALTHEFANVDSQRFGGLTPRELETLADTLENKVSRP
ncbi:MAG: hypothetical protein GY778_02545 [bacterium]|nr:hypothetical protein [bacterium]